jgi:glycine/sarcosine N-methyltransferase
MGFYEAISRYYDFIFPVDPGAVEFLAARVLPGSPSLDVACGTGGHAVALARKGHPVTGVDLDASMIERARRKGRGLPVRFEVRDMTGLAEGPDLDSPSAGESPFGLVYCVGNSLVHLDSGETIRLALSGWRALMAPGGRLVIQIIHYDGVLARGAVGLPTIRDEERGLEFVRRYEYSPGGTSVQFRTVLTVQEGGKPRRIEGAIPLRILKAAELQALVGAAGFDEVELFGGFGGGPLTPESLPLVLTARR